MAGNILAGTGVVPGGTTAAFNELNATTRRAFIPRVTVQIYFSTPTLMMLMAQAQRTAGGLNQITGPVQGASLVPGAWTGYSGTFNKPQVIPGLQAFGFNTAYFVIPVPLVMGEALLQSTETIIPILDARMNDVYAVAAQQMGSALFTNNTANTLMPSSFVDAFDDGSAVATYGGINRNGSNNSFWASNKFSNANPLTRAIMSNYLLRITDLAGGEKPDYVVMSPSDYSQLNSTFITSENIYVTPGAAYTDSFDTQIRSSFPNLIIAGVPFFADHWCPEGTAYFVNSKYTAMYLSEDAPFAFSGFYSAIPVMQIAQVGVMIVGYQIVCAKPVSGAQLTGFTGQGAW